MQDKVHVHILHYYAGRMYDINTILMAVGYSPVVHRVQKTKCKALCYKRRAPDTRCANFEALGDGSDNAGLC